MKKAAKIESAWRNRIVGSGSEDPERLVANPRNWRIHSERQQGALRELLDQVGWVQQVVVNRKSGFVVDGHARIALALDRGEKRVPVLYIELSDREEAIVVATLDPSSSLATVDREALLRVIADAKGADPGIDALLDRIAGEHAAHQVGGELEEIPPERAKELLAKWKVKVGDVWRCGMHRVLCGDALAQGAIFRATGSGRRARLLFTDPPWNVAYGSAGSSQAARLRSDGKAHRSREIANDNLGARFPAFIAAAARAFVRAIEPGAAAYVVMGAQEWPTIDAALRDAGLHWSSTIIWAKDSLIPVRKDYQAQYEPIWYGWRGGAARRLRTVADRTQSDLWRIPRPRSSPEHPTAKPVELVERAVVNSSEAGWIVLDPFLGGGSTLLACERSGRRCAGVELDPKYVAVALERWSLLTSERPRRAAR